MMEVEKLPFLNMIVKTVNFVKSSGKWQECPEPTIPEYAFIGRSNVGNLR